MAMHTEWLSQELESKIEALTPRESHEGKSSVFVGRCSDRLRGDHSIIVDT